MIPKQKGWYHVALVSLAFAEVYLAKTKVRKVLNLGCAMWHCQAVYYHFVLEPKEVLGCKPQ